MPVIDINGLIANRVEAIRAYHESESMPRAEVDLSGGIDSAVIAALCVLALGADKVTCVYSSIDSSEDSLVRAREVAVCIGVQLVELDLSGLFTSLTCVVENAVVEALLGSEACQGLDTRAMGMDESPFEIGLADIRLLKESDPTVEGSLRSCLRAPVGRYVNRLRGRGLRHGTGNECEDRIVRFYQKGGDGEVDLNVIEMLSKGEVYQLARGLGLPRSVRAARPSPDLWGEVPHHDEDELSSWVGITPPDGMGWYSTVDPDTGLYTSVGLLERIARVDDLLIDADSNPGAMRSWLFDDIRWFAYKTRRLLWAAQVSGTFPNTRFTGDELLEIVAALKKVERSTRHKENPNIPTLGTRRELREAGAITDDLPLPKE